MAIKLKTKIPGPRSVLLSGLKKKYVSSAIASAIPVFVKSAKGAVIQDIDENFLIDFTGGIGAANSGHGNAFVTNAIKKQAGRFLHSSFPILGYKSYIEVCKKLNSLVVIPGDKKSVLFNSGAEAVENAVKIARKFTGKSGVVSFEEGFHGRTLLTLSMAGKLEPYKLGFGPFVPECYKLHYPYLYRRPEQMDDGEYVDYLLEYIENDFFKTVVSPKNVACVVMEMVAGEGGFIVAPKKYVRELAKLCKEKDILFISDEIQTGFGRTGKMFAFEHFGIRPDIITMGKSLSNGLPLSAVTGRAELLDSVQEGGLGGTFGGNPVACEAALAAFDFIKKKNLPEKAAKIGDVVLKCFDKFENNYNIVGDVRGLGAMCALEIVKDKKSKKPDKERTKKIIRYCYENGLLLTSCGVYGNVIRTLMPLVISHKELMEGLDVLEGAIRKSNGK